MNYYVLGENDQPQSSWVMFRLVKPEPKRPRNPELPPVMYRFFGPQPDGRMQLKPEFGAICCGKCGRYDEDAAYKIGFHDPAIIRVKGDFTHTQDRIFVVSERFLQALQKAKTQGFETAPVGTTGWHALCPTMRVDSADEVMKEFPPFCPECGRPERAGGIFKALGQLSPPKAPNAVFTTKRSWPTPLWDRDFFLTEQVVKVLKAAGIKGGYCNRLWTEQEVAVAKTKGPGWKPPGSTVFLNGK
jgi:hypothetical protein